MEPILCPLCTRSTLERLLQTVTILARVNGESTIGGALAYRCLEHGHIFFLREADVSAPFPASTNA